jgi:acyl-coenzyme A thioesterase PaaI-like protein
LGSRTKLLLAALLGIEVAAVELSNARVRPVGKEAIARPGGMIAGPVLFAMTDMASCGLTLVLLRRRMT